MPYYYQTGNANNSIDLLDAIVQFLTVPGSNGYTLIGSNNDEYDSATPTGTHYRSRYFESIEGEFFSLSTQTANPNTVWITHFGSYTPATPTGAVKYFYQQPGAGGYYALCNLLQGPYVAYHFFRGVEGVRGRYFHCCVEYEAGSFSHFGFGEVDPIGDRTVRYTNGLNWNTNPSFGYRDYTSSYHQRPFDGMISSANGGYGGLHINYNTPQRGEPSFNPAVNESYFYTLSAGPKGLSAGGYGGTGHWQRSGLNGPLFDDSPSELYARSILLPCHCNFDETSYNVGGASGLKIFRIVGIAPAFRMVNIKYLNPGDIVDNNWKVFPLKSKTSTTGPYSGEAGIAYRYQ